MATTQSTFGMSHYTVVPENFDPERSERLDDEREKRDERDRTA